MDSRNSYDPADLAKLYNIGRSEAYLLAEQIGAVRFGARASLYAFRERPLFVTRSAQPESPHG